MADNDSGAAQQEPVQSTEEKPQAADAAPKPDSTEEPAPGDVTAEVNAPDGDGTAEAVVAEPTEGTGEAAAAAGKDKKRKSTGGVPEHKNKKINRKKSSTNLALNLDCKPGELYWARLKGYPPWPSVIADEEMLPETLLATRPVSTERADGTLREDFKEGGKNAKDRTFPIMFLSTNEFAWMPNTSLTKLDPEECKNKSTKISKQLSAAYDLATEAPDLDYFKRILKQFQEETVAYEAEQRQKQAEADAKAAAKAEKDAANKEKKARKSKGGDGDTEMTDADGAKSKKRKKEADSDADGAKAKKTPKITLNASKTNGDSKKASASKKKVAAPEKEEKQEMTEAEKAQQREKSVLYLRHRLQKAFLTNQPLKEEEMSGMNDFFVQLEAYEGLEPHIIRATKIHKVLKAIIKLNIVPKDEEYHFKKRSQTMLEEWNTRMEANGTVSSKPAEEKPATNGETHVDEAKAEKQADEIDQKVESAESSDIKKSDEPEAEEVKPQPAADGDEKMAEA